MRNITPRVYYLNDNPNPIHDYEIYNYEKQKFYNISDRSHIEPRAKNDDEFKDFYNLIALCKICHHEVGKAQMLDMKELKRLKLRWMIASGRFTRLEIDAISQIYDGSESSKKYSWIRGLLRLTDANGNELPLIHPWAYITLSLNVPLYKNLFDLKFITCTDSRSIIADGDISFNPVFFRLTEAGINFCEKFAMCTR